MIKKLNDRISLIFTEQGFKFCNAVLIEDDIRAVIDSGSGKIIEEVRPVDVDILVNSHCHLDHINGNDLFTRARIFIHENDAASMKRPELVTGTLGWSEMMGDDIISHADELGGYDERILNEWRVDEAFSDNKIFRTGKTEFIAFHTPGHTAGHCSFYFPDLEFLFLADICLTAAGPWYGGIDSNIDDFLLSIEKIMNLKPKILATGHVPGLIEDNIKKKLAEYRERIFKREKRILDFITNNPSSVDEISARNLIYRIHPTSFVLFWEKCMVLKHLQRLIKQGRIINDGISYRA